MIAAIKQCPKFKTEKEYDEYIKREKALIEMNNNVTDLKKMYSELSEDVQQFQNLLDGLVTIDKPASSDDDAQTEAARRKEFEAVSGGVSVTDMFSTEMQNQL